MIKLRLRRMGATKKPSYRIVVADARSKRDGRFIEVLGIYNPLTDPSTIRLDGDRARYWLSQGAQPTERVAKLLKIEGVTDAEGKLVKVATDTSAIVGAVEPVAGACPESHPIKGNHSGGGELIYHVPGGRFYNRTQPEFCFATEAEAQTAGFRASKA